MSFNRPVRFTRLLEGSNGIFWLTFSVYFVLQAQSYRPHVKSFEEVTPPYIFWSHAFPVRAFMNPFMRFTRFVQWPSFFGAIPLNLYFSRHGILDDHLYW